MSATLPSGRRSTSLRRTLIALLGAAAAIAFAAPTAGAAPTIGSFTNPDLNSIPSQATTTGGQPNTSGNANRYPSNLRVRNLYPHVTDANVTFESLSHTFPADIDALLVGPQGQSVLLMSDTGDGNQVNGVRLTFDDSAGTTLPNGTQITSGTYRPTNYGTPDPFGAPAPTGTPPGTYSSLLSSLNNSNPNGNWRLFVVDDAGADIGELDGWTLNLRASPNAGACTNRLTGTNGADNLPGGAGGDRIRGRGGDDRLRSFGGRDCISGGSGNDLVSGGARRDRLSGGSGNDRILGGSGSDRIRAVDGTRDRVNCGSGNDTARVDRRDSVRRCEHVTRVG